MNTKMKTIMIMMNISKMMMTNISNMMIKRESKSKMEY